MSDHERIPTDDPIRQIWTRFGVLESVAGASRLLERRARELGVEADETALREKAAGLAFAVRSAREYFGVPIQGNVTAACLAFYYGSMSLLQAVLVADPRNDLNLAHVEEFTRFGHGLSTFTEPGEPFPDSEKLLVLANGFLPRFLAAAEYGVDAAGLSVTRRYSAMAEVPEDERDRVLTAKDLVGRIPELRSLYAELFGDMPNYVVFDRVGGDDSTRLHFPHHKNRSGFSVAALRGFFGWGEEIELQEDHEGIRTAQRPLADFGLTSTFHATVMADTSYVRALNGLSDVFVFEFMLLYLLSIWVRYRPALWREISEGANSDFRALVVNHLMVVERTFPNEMLNRLYDRKFLFAGFAYLS